MISKMRETRRVVREIISKGDGRFDGLLEMPARKVVNPLISLLCSVDERMKWGAVSALGRVVSRLAEHDKESARVVMRRLMWHLNDESGGVGWGVPEAMAEIMAQSRPMALEYSKILVSYIREDGNYLEHPALQAGALWGIARMAEVRPELVQDAGPWILPFLTSSRPGLRGLAALAAAGRDTPGLKPALEKLETDFNVIQIYQNGFLVERSIAELAKSVL